MLSAGGTSCRSIVNGQGDKRMISGWMDGGIELVQQRFAGRQ